MANLTYGRRKEGRTVSNGALEILLLDEDLNRIHDNIRDEINSHIQDTGDTIKIDDWLAEADRLSALARRIVDPESGIDLFPYLPLTKAGKFPKNRNTLIAKSRCSYGENYEYPFARRIEIRLVPAYEDSIKWLYDQRMENTVIMALRMGDTVSKPDPIFDLSETPHKPDTTRAVYLKDDAVTAGRIYEDKTGNQFLVLTGCKFIAHVSAYKTDSPDETPWCSYTLNAGGPEKHTYVKWTKVLERACGKDTSFNNIMQSMAARDKTSMIPDRLSVRENPRKFVKEVNVLFNPESIQPENIAGPLYRNTATNGYDQVTYQILPYADSKKG